MSALPRIIPTLARAATSRATIAAAAARPLSHIFCGRGSCSQCACSRCRSFTSTAPGSCRFFSSGIQRLMTEDPRMSKIVIHGGVVYLSGQTAGDAGDTIEAQTKATLAKIDDLLQVAGVSKSELLTANIWLKDIDRDFKAMNAVWNAWVDPKNKPVRATVQSPMAVPSLLVEVQVTAAAK